MYLRSIRIRNYRAVREGLVTLDKTTLLIGENNSGRTSILEALMLILGAPEDRFETRLKPIHFHRGPDGVPGALEIRLSIEEDREGAWNPPAEVSSALPGMKRSRRAFEFVFEATLEHVSGRIDSRWFLSGKPRSDARLENNPVLLVWIRELLPVLWLRSGLTARDSGQPSGQNQDPLLASLDRHYRNLITGEAPDLNAELEYGANAASVVMSRQKELFAGAAPMMGAMASDILKRRTVSAPALEARSKSPAQKLGMLLLLGAILQLTRRSVLPEARPLLVLDDPEANLHPMTLAATWRVTERITWQKIITTNSGTLLSNAPLSDIRRLTRHGGTVQEWSVPRDLLSREDQRRVAYHVRSRRASAMFARCWLLVEGETEFWVMPELARVLGYDFAEEGIVPVEFAQCGLSPLIKLADRLGIAWLVLTDGDDAGDHYVAAAEGAGRGAGPRHAGARITQLQEADIENCFWHNGFDDVIRRIAYSGATAAKASAKAAIKKAIERASKPFLALSLIEAAAERGPESVPAILKSVIDACVDLARTEIQPRG